LSIRSKYGSISSQLFSIRLCLLFPLTALSALVITVIVGASLQPLGEVEQRGAILALGRGSQQLQLLEFFLRYGSKGIKRGTGITKVKVESHGE
jgi:hypothetical protein